MIRPFWHVRENFADGPLPDIALLLLAAELIGKSLRWFLGQGMPQKHSNNERDADQQRQEPIREVRQFLPKRQLLAIINVEGNQHQTKERPIPVMCSLAQGGRR